MKLILLEKINKLGTIGDEVVVKSGFARNYLLPSGKALVLNQDNKAYFESKRVELEQASKDQLVKAESIANQINQLDELTLMVRSSEEGKLYGSVKQVDIVGALAKHDIAIEKNMVHLSQSIKEIGEYNVTIQVHPDVVCSCKIIVGPA